MLPPPLPLVPFLIAAGAMQYSVTRFLTALTIGRIIRYTVLAFLGATYGRHILGIFSHHVYLALFIGLAVMLVTIVAVLVARKRR
jgi:membrane protein DedA with SNARE-associated domain